MILFGELHAATYMYIFQKDNAILIHNAAFHGELDTLKDLIEEKNVDPCMANNVSIWRQEFRI